MPFVAAIGTHLPCPGCDAHRIGGGDEDAITPAVEAGRATRPLVAVEQAFEAATRWGACKFAESEHLGFAPRYRVAQDGAPARGHELVAPPRTRTVYTAVSVHIPVPGLRTPYASVIVELDGVDVPALVKSTGAVPDSVNIGDRGRLVLRRVAVRSGVPDYGCAFQAESEAA